MRICTIGDVLLDVVVRLDEPIAPDSDAYGRTQAGPGGQAANVAAWASALGGSGRVIGMRAADAAGRIVVAELRSRGVDVAGPERARGTGTIVSIATPDGARTMLSDRGVAPELGPGDLQAEWLEGCDWLHVPGYSLVRAPLRDAALEAARAVPRVSVDASSTAAIAAVGAEDFNNLIALLAPELVLANEDEAALLAGEPAATLVIKRGARGCTVQRGGETNHYEALPADVADSTGAGDAFAAGFLLGGPVLALQAAARCVAKLGGMP